MPTKVTDEQFRVAWDAERGHVRNVAVALGLTERATYGRRNKLKAKYGWALGSGGHGNGAIVPANDYLQRVPVEGFTGTAVVFSDAHYHPGIGSTVAHKALLEVVKETKPKMVVANGDIFDGARISRFPRNGWENQPRVSDELDEVRERMSEIRHAYRGAQLKRTIGNHCIRFDRHLSTHAGEFEGVMGTRLSDHLPEWQECMSVMVNGSTMIKHRFNGGIHAAYNNTLRAGTNIVTGHTHHLEVKPWGDYRGRRYGVQTGAIADVAGPQFGYTEDNPTAWCSGFAVLTFDKDGRLLMPELCEVIEGVAYFRGQRVAGRRKVAA